MRVLVIEDDKSLGASLKQLMESQGYACDLAVNGEDGLFCALEYAIDVAIIDIGLGDDIEGGFELCRNLRAQAPLLPIMFLTARDSEIDIVSGFRLGADDYLTKDISQAHMLARINALLRRAQALAKPEASEHKLLRGSLALSLERMTVQWQQQPVDLTVTEFWIIHALAERVGHVKNRQQLMIPGSWLPPDQPLAEHQEPPPAPGPPQVPGSWFLFPHSSLWGKPKNRHRFFAATRETGLVAPACFSPWGGGTCKQPQICVHNWVAVW